jgi:hypothetical protein
MVQTQSTDELLIKTFAKLHASALGIACGTLGLLGIFAGTAVPLLKGNSPIRPTLILLSQYFPGYSVTWKGSFIGAAYGLFVGFIAGWTLAFLRNLTVTAYLHAVRLWVNLSTDHFLDRFDS